MSNNKKTFIWVTQDFSGLGFAIRCSDEGNVVILAYKLKEDDDGKNAESVGDGLISKVPLETIVEGRAKFKDAYWIFDGNHNSDIGEMLRREGYKVLGGDEFSDKMEHDRQFAIDIIHKAGIDTPATFEFSDKQAGIDFLEANEDTAFVFKPDEPDSEAWITTVPDSDNPREANEEIRLLLEASSDGHGDYILQELKQGTEINVECFVYRGKPFFAHANFESKRKLNHDFGVLVGCSQDIEHPIALDSKILRETVHKLLKLPEYASFTGFVDGNFIVADNKYWYLESCQRFGYNAHPNLFLTLAISPVSEILAAWLDKDIYDFYRHFRQGFGASISLYIDAPVQGLPLLIPEELKVKFYPFDIYKHEDRYCLAGYAKEVGIITAHDYDLKSAADEALSKFYRIHYPSKSGRTDLDLTNYQSNPQERYTACQAMKLF